MIVHAVLMHAPTSCAYSAAVYDSAAVSKPMVACVMCAIHVLLTVPTRACIKYFVFSLHWQFTLKPHTYKRNQTHNQHKPSKQQPSKATSRDRLPAHEFNPYNNTAHTINTYGARYGVVCKAECTLCTTLAC